METQKHAQKSVKFPFADGGKKIFAGQCSVRREEPLEWPVRKVLALLANSQRRKDAFEENGKTTKSAEKDATFRLADSQSSIAWNYHGVKCVSVSVAKKI